MTIETTKYLRKPLEVEAVRVTEDNFYELAHWCNGEPMVDVSEDNPRGLKYIKVRVHSPVSVKQTQAHIGDWILYSSKGYKIYNNRAFEKSFDLAPGPAIKKAWDEFKSAVTELRLPDEPIPSEKKHFRSSEV